MIKPLAELRLFYIIAVVCLVFSTYAAYQANHKSFKDCQRIETLKSYNYTNALRAKQALPLSAYYIEHPEELRGALNNVSQQIVNYAPHTCHESILPWR